MEVKDEEDFLNVGNSRPAPPPGRGVFLEAVFASSLDGIFVIDRRGRFVDVNPAGCSMFGYERAELLSSPITLLLFPEDIEEAEKKLEMIMTGKMDGRKGELRLRHKVGSEVWVELAVNFFSVEGVSYVLAIKRDMTSARRLRDELLSARAGRGPSGASGEKKARVLVMDDEEMIRDVSVEMLKLLGYDAGCAPDGQRAVDIFMEARESGSPFDAVILDLTVADGMGGLETMERLLELDPGVRAIVSSGYADDPVMSAYDSYGFSAVISKPYRVAELGSVVKAVLEK